MKHPISGMPSITVVAVFLGLCLSCTQFPTQFGYIGPQYVQTVGFVFSPLAEGAPGDTIHLTAYFEGQPVQYYSCSLSTQYSLSMYGMDTAVNFKPVVDPNATTGPDSIRLSFVIPQDFFAAAGPLIASFLQSLPDSARAMLGFDSTVINSIQPGQWPALVGQFLTQTDFSLADSETCRQAAHFAQIMSGQAVLHLAVNGGYTISRKISVRYNSRIRGNRFVFINRNPDPQWIAIYKVKNRSQLFFGPADLNSDDTMLCLYAKDTSVLAGPKRFTDTVLIDTGYTYYAAADSGIIIRDSTTPGGSTITVKDTLLDKYFTYANLVEYEYYSYLWFYEPDPAQAASVKPENSLIIANSRGYYSQFLPPLDTTVKNVTLWLRVSDQADGELNRPIATTLKETHVVLTYTPRYASSAKKK